MENNNTTEYIHSHTLNLMMNAQQSVSRVYDTRNYFGACMRSIEEQSAEFLTRYVNGDIAIKPADFGTMELYLEILSDSKFSQITKILKKAREKFTTDVATENEKNATQTLAQPEQQTQKSENILIIPAPVQSMPVKPQQNVPLARPVVTTPHTYSATHGSINLNILENKKKMHVLSSADMLKLGERLNNERNFSTTKLRSKFISFVSYRIDMVLSGKMSPDESMDKLVELYAPTYQRIQYQNRKKFQKSVQPVTPAPQEKPNKESTTLNLGRKISGFFTRVTSTVKQATTTAFNKVKRPLAVAGILALSIFGGKKVFDATTSENHQPQPTKTEQVAKQTVTTQTQSNKKTADFSTAAKTIATQTAAKTAPQQISKPNTSSVSTQNTVFQQTLNKLNNIKSTNPTDRNMDVQKTAKNLYKQFGSNTYLAVLACAITPTTLNQYAHFDFAPTTHNLIEYLSTHDLTPAQRDGVNKYLQSMSISNFKTVAATLAMQQQMQR